jgi:Zn-dependent protease
VQVLDLSEFLSEISIWLAAISVWAIPVLFAITLHEVAHGWTARYFGDQTAQLLGRLSLNPLRHIDPLGTVMVPGALLLAFGFPLFGWAKPMPVETSGLANPRRTLIMVALAGPAANILMAILWGGVLTPVSLLPARLGAGLERIAPAGMFIVVGLSVLGLLGWLFRPAYRAAGQLIQVLGIGLST